MKKYIYFIIFMVIFLHGKPFYKGNYKFKTNTIHAIPSDLKMPYSHGRYRGCPNTNDLRYLKIRYFGFDGNTHNDGELIVHKNVAEETLYIFKRLYNSRYPIKRMVLVEAYQGDDFKSIEYDNTSAYNCRPVTGGGKLSNHAHGTAIDINPIENPYVSRSGRIAHKRSYTFGIRNRRHYKKTHTNVAAKAIILKTDNIVDYFSECGWRWGGDWISIKDYQHFDKPDAHFRKFPHKCIPSKYTKTNSNTHRHLKNKSSQKIPRKNKNCKKEYIIKSGDGLLSIAKKYNTTITEIKKCNPEITNDNVINAGGKLFIPIPH